MLKKKVKKTRLFFVFARISPPFSVHFPNCINTRMYRKKNPKNSLLSSTYKYRLYYHSCIHV